MLDRAIEHPLRAVHVDFQTAQSIDLSPPDTKKGGKMDDGTAPIHGLANGRHVQNRSVKYLDALGYCFSDPDDLLPQIQHMDLDPAPIQFAHHLYADATGPAGD
jgi:hypothetical protein